MFQREGRKTLPRTVTNQLTDQIRQVIGGSIRLIVDVAVLDDDSDLTVAGLTTLSAIDLMFALESAFGLEFPERLVRRDTFTSIASIRAAIDEVIRAG